MLNSNSFDKKYFRELAQLFRDLRSLAIANRGYFKGAPGLSNEGFYVAFTQLLDHLDNGVVSGVNAILRIAHLFDLDETVPGNGYRSFVTVVQKCCVRIMALGRYVSVNRESYLFRAGHYSKELMAYVTTLGQLRACLYYVQKLVSYCKEGELFLGDDILLDNQHPASRLMLEVECLNQEAFYGRCLGFQFCESMVRPLTTINLVMASYAEGYSKTDSSILRLANSVVGCGKYFMNPELRAQQVVNMTRTCDIHFCKAFWSLPENSFMHNVPLYMCPSVAVTRVISLDPVPFELPLADGSGSITILPPSAHTGVGPVMTRLISAEYRSGQEIWYNKYRLKLSSLKSPIQKSPCLIIQCHGGGFVAQSSASHQMYLNDWATDLGVPILSIDYSLAPESYFPRQQEEVFYAYCWALKNCHMLGSLGEKICIVGDSAGANIAFSVLMRLKECGLRQPDGVVSIYGSPCVKYLPSPSRILSLMDPLLPLGVVALCLKAYTSDCMRDSSSVQGSEAEMTSSLNGEKLRSSSVVSEMSKNQSGDESSSLGELHQTRQCHHRGDSGFFYLGVDGGKGDAVSVQSLQVMTRSGEMTGTSSSESLAEEIDPSSSTVFVLKESSDEEMDSLPSSCDEQTSFSKEFVDDRIAPASHQCIHSSPAYRSTSDAAAHSSSVSTFSDTLPLFPLPDSGSPLMSSYAKICRFAKSPMENSKDLKTASDPFVSPLVASDEHLQNLCPIYFVACHLDPLLDDSVMFARRLRCVGNQVHLELVPDLPHGFLNFVLVSPEARAGSKRCIRLMKKVLSLQS